MLRKPEVQIPAVREAPCFKVGLSYLSFKARTTATNSGLEGDGWSRRNR